MRGGHGLGTLWPAGGDEAATLFQQWRVDHPGVGCGLQQAVVGGSRAQLGSKPVSAALEGPRLAGSGRCGAGSAGAGDLAAANDGREKPVHGRWRQPQLRG